MIYKIIILAFLLGVQILRPSFYGEHGRTVLYRFARWGFFISVSLTLFVAGYYTAAQYQIWQASPVAKLLLPPHQPLGYFIKYSTTHFWIDSLIAIAAALIGLLAAKAINKKYQGRFFWTAEPWLFATALLLVGHPGWLYYVVALFGAYFLWHLIHLVTRRRTERVSLYYFWLPIAISIIIINEWLPYLLRS